MLFTDEGIADIFHMDRDKTKNLIIMLLKQEYIEKNEDKYKFTEQGRIFLESMHESGRI